MRKTVLFVCHANTARSVIAHALLERMLAARRADGRVRVRSGGIGPIARDGMLPSLDACLALGEAGIPFAQESRASVDLKRHPELVAEADLILTMSGEQKRMVAALGEASGRPIFTLREFAGEAGDIRDPAGQGEDVFRACLVEIRRCLERSIDRLVDGEWRAG